MSESSQNNTTASPRHFLFLAIAFAVLMFILVRPADTSSLTTENIWSEFSFTHSVFEDILVNAEVAFVKNVQSDKVVYQTNASQIFPLASLTKIMTAYSAREILGNQTVTITSEDLRSVGDHGLVVGETWNVDDLLVFMLVTSSNDAAEAVSRTAQMALEGESFPEYMTRRATELGFTTLSFQNASGLDIEVDGSPQPSAVGTAEDLSNLFIHAHNQFPELFNPTREFRMSLASDTKEHVFENTNTSLSILPRLEGSKTGYTQTAGGNLSVITNINGEPHVVTVLRSTREGRFQDIGTIIRKTQESL